MSESTSEEDDWPDVQPAWQNGCGCGFCLGLIARPAFLYLYWAILLHFGGSFDDKYLAAYVLSSVPIGAVLGTIIYPLILNNLSKLSGRFKK